MRESVILLLVFVLSCSVFGQRRFKDGQIVLKVLPDYRVNCSDTAIHIQKLENIFAQLQVVRVSKKFPHLNPPQLSRAQAVSKTDLSLIYSIEYSARISPMKAAEWVNQTGVVQYAEPAYIAQVLGKPNDALINNQWHLEIINAFSAWDITTGSGNKKIAIIDTGVDWDHPDLADAISLNLEDPIDGLDNDDNGFIDDFRGWNFYDNNNDPDELSWSHGTHVAGLAGAIANNAEGVAGSSYSAKIIAIKSGHQLELTHGYEGIAYAMQMGADVINCSWGSTDYTFFGHDVVKSATEDGVLIICGGGNNNNDDDFYPAAFPEAMAVAATDIQTNKAIFSSYYYNMDISAPGENVYSTKNGTYDYDNGTSMSAPIVAGAAALVLDRFGYLTPAELKAQLEETSTNIDSLNENAQYAHRLGKGLLNMQAALDTLVKTSIAMPSFEFTDNDDEIYVLGDVVDLGIELVNVFEAVNEITVQLSVLDSAAELIDSVKTFPALAKNGRANNVNSPFQFRIVNRGAYNEIIDFRLDIHSGNYHRVEHLRLLINPDFVNVNVNNVATSVSSFGHVGYADNQRSRGLGFQLEAEGNFLYESGLLIGSQSYGYTKVVDRVRGEAFTDRDFWPVSIIEKKMAQNGEAYYASGSFQDSSAIEDEIGLTIHQKTSAYTDQGHENYMIVEYTIINTGEREINDLYAGAYADWDIRTANENRGKTAYGKRFGYVYSADDVPYTGGIVQLNSDYPFHSFMMDNAALNAETVDLTLDGFSSEEKWFALTNNRFQVGDEGLGVDVSHTVSVGSIPLDIGDSVTVAFAYVAARNQQDALMAADSAFKRYNGFSPGEDVLALIQSVRLSPNPTQGHLRFDFELKESTEFGVEVYNAQGALLQSLGAQTFFAGPNILEFDLPEAQSGIYFIRLHGGVIDRNFRVSYIRP